MNIYVIAGLSLCLVVVVTGVPVPEDYEQKFEMYMDEIVESTVCGSGGGGGSSDGMLLELFSAADDDDNDNKRDPSRPSLIFACGKYKDDDQEAVCLTLLKELSEICNNQTYDTTIKQALGTLHFVNRLFEPANEKLIRESVQKAADLDSLDDYSCDVDSPLRLACILLWQINSPLEKTTTSKSSSSSTSTNTIGTGTTTNKNKDTTSNNEKTEVQPERKTDDTKQDDGTTDTKPKPDSTIGSTAGTTNSHPGTSTGVAGGPGNPENPVDKEADMSANTSGTGTTTNENKDTTSNNEQTKVQPEKETDDAKQDYGMSTDTKPKPDGTTGSTAGTTNSHPGTSTGVVGGPGNPETPVEEDAGTTGSKDNTGGGDGAGGATGVASGAAGGAGDGGAAGGDSGAAAGDPVAASGDTGGGTGDATRTGSTSPVGSTNQDGGDGTTNDIPNQFDTSSLLTSPLCSAGSMLFFYQDQDTLHPSPFNAVCKYTKDPAKLKVCRAAFAALNEYCVDNKYAIRAKDVEGWVNHDVTQITNDEEGLCKFARLNIAEPKPDCEVCSVGHLYVRRICYMLWFTNYYMLADVKPKQTPQTTGNTEGDTVSKTDQKDKMSTLNGENNGGVSTPEENNNKDSTLEENDGSPTEQKEEENNGDSAQQNPENNEALDKPDSGEESSDSSDTEDTESSVVGFRIGSVGSNVEEQMKNQPDEKDNEQENENKVDETNQNTYNDVYKNRNYEEEESSSHFLAFSLTAIILILATYIAYHNKHKIIAVIIEGRTGKGRRGGSYRRLNQNVSDAMPTLKA